ncbi:MAG: rhamnosyltransferase [Gammaproteobacteria bacterium]|nr:MAG: rhamnosyltransferase [Gammaproteobacteria bacterium]
MDEWLEGIRNKIGLFVPTLNPGTEWQQWIEGLKKQTLQPKRILIIDSSSYDGSVHNSQDEDFEIRFIPRHSFNHGGTRQLGLEILHDMDFLIYMTQDAILTDPRAFEELLTPFKEELVAASYGKQLPKQNASYSAAAIRNFNYPNQSQTKSFADRTRLGIKTPFLSNSFSAYRRASVVEIGGFPKKSLVSEDMFVSAMLLKRNYRIRYQASAQVHHSHNFSIKELFQRYFDIGVFHHREQWINNMFGSTDREGVRFLIRQLKSLGIKRSHLAPGVILSTAIKYIGFRLGLLEKVIPVSIKRLLSVQKFYWLN